MVLVNITNLIEAFSLLKATPTDIMVPIRNGGGTSEFLWKGKRETPTTQIEIGLHPDILSTIADMLIDASQRTQLIVTTHSDALISTLPPESVLICERDDEGSHLHRLEAEPLKDWLENYTIGDLWRMGHIGGKPW